MIANFFITGDMRLPGLQKACFASRATFQHLQRLLRNAKGSGIISSRQQASLHSGGANESTV